MRYLPYLVQVNSLEESESIFSGIDVDPMGIKLMEDKALFYPLMLKDLTPPQANIIKQYLLSCGGEAVCGRGVINNSIKNSDVLLLATLNQYRKLINKLKANKFALPEIAHILGETLKNIESVPPPIKIKNRPTLDFGKRTYIMGIINVTPDSFSDGGKFYAPQAAIAHAKSMIHAGADIIDIGGESTRPGSQPISAKEELRRIMPVIETLAKNRKCIISVDTQKSEVADMALKSGAHIINDVSALRSDKKMAKTIAKYKASVILMHMRGTPDIMQVKPAYKDLFFEILSSLKDSLEIANKAGILFSRIIVDPGFGFGKSLSDNFMILRNLRTFKVLGRPILVGASRKKMIGSILGVPPDKRLIGTAATIPVAILNGANIIRVHDVFEMKQSAKIADAVIGRRLR
ncbi:dihydropteroate synthase [Candidatus Saganbacteria bacterium]|nr:dihydropteroate synthase [Candidatus Saganbacteria bacterium]